MIQFKTEKRKVKDLIPYKYNPRVLTKAQRQALEKSFEEFGYVEICAINKDNVIIAGHQRVNLMLDLGWEDKEIDVRVSNKQLDVEEMEKYLLMSNKIDAEWDFDMLNDHFDLDLLKDVGFSDQELGLDIDEDATGMSDPSESCNFTIKCDDMAQLDQLKAKMKTSKSNISFDKFLERIV